MSNEQEAALNAVEVADTLRAAQVEVEKPVPAAEPEQVRHVAKPPVNFAKGDMAREQVLHRLGPFRTPTDVTRPKFKAIQEKCLELGLLIHDLCPTSQEKSTALTLLTQVKMCANASVALYSSSEES